MDALLNNGYSQHFFSLMGSGSPALIIQLAILNIAALVAWLGWRTYYKRVMRKFTMRVLQALLVGANMLVVTNVSGDLAQLAGFGSTWF